MYLDLTVEESYNINENIVACDNYSWLGTTYSISGIYDSLLLSINGCDSLVTIDLTINHSDTITSSVNSCESYVWNGLTLDTSGIYSFVFTNSSGCDSLAFLDLSINNTIAEIIAPLNPNNSDLSVNIISGISPFTYQWNTGETTPIITPINNGDYWLIVTDYNGCVSDTIYYNVNWISSNVSEFQIDKLNIYPNPSNDIFYIKFKSTINQNIILRIINIIGEEIYSDFLNNYTGEFSKIINLHNKSKGVYY